MTIIAIDFDETITANPEKAKESFRELRKRGHYIVIWSTRNNPKQHGENQPKMMEEMIKYLQSHNIPYDEIDDGKTGKCHAQVYIDDKAIRFKNNWDEILEEIY